MAWWFGLVVWLGVFAPLSTKAQTVLSVSANVNCLLLATNGVNYTCDAGSPNVATTTTMQVLVNPLNSDASDQITFQLQLTSLPQPGLVQPGSSDTCTAPSPAGMCAASTPTSVTITATKPIVGYQLRPTFEVPFMYYSSSQLQLYQATTSYAPNTKLVLRTARVDPNLAGSCPLGFSLSGPSQAWNANPTTNYKSMKCSPSRLASKNIDPEGIDVGTISRPAASPGLTNFTCPGGSIQLVFQPTSSVGNEFNYFQVPTTPDNALFLRNYPLPIGPICRVFSIQPRAQVFGQVNVTIVNDIGTRSILLDNIGVGSAASTAEADFFTAIQNVISSDQFYAPSLSGNIVICASTLDAVDSFTMIPPGGDPLSNPYSQMPDPAYRLPVPEVNNFLRGVDTQSDLFYFWYYINSTSSNALGAKQFQLGMSPTIFTQSYSSIYLTALMSSLGVGNKRSSTLQTTREQLSTYTTPFSNTGAPQFFSTYYGAPIYTPCQALVQLYNATGQSNITLGSVLPPYFNRQKGNMWIDKGILYLEQQNNIQYQLLMAFSGTLLNVRGSVSYGTIDTVASSCIVDDNEKTHNATLFLTICNESSQPARFRMTLTCNPGSNLTPDQSEFTSERIGVHSCSTQYLGLQVVGPVPNDATCVATLYPTNPTLNIYLVKTSSASFVCSVFSTIPPQLLTNASQIAVNALSAVPTPVPENDGAPQSGGNKSWFYIGLATFIAVVLLGVVVCIVIIIVSSIQTKKAKRFVQENAAYNR